MLDRLVAYRFDMFSWLYKTGLQRCKRGLVAWLPGNARSGCFQQQAKLAQGSLAQTDTYHLTLGKAHQRNVAAPSPGLRIHSTRPQHSISMPKKYSRQPRRSISVATLTIRGGFAQGLVRLHLNSFHVGNDRNNITKNRDLF